MRKKLFLFLAMHLTAFAFAQDGSIDLTFNPLDSGYGAGDGANSEVKTSVAQPDGKVLIAGNFSAYNSTSINRIARINQNGRLDATFNPGLGADALINVIKLQPDGKILVAGNFDNFNGQLHPGITRLNADGSIDASFRQQVFNAGIDVTAMALQSNGKIIIASSTDYIIRLNSDGTNDASFASYHLTATEINSVVPQPDGKVIVAGSFYEFNGTTVHDIIRLDAAGELDPTFNSGSGTGSIYPINSVQLQSDGKILIFGEFSTYNGVSSSRMARLNSDGTKDATYIGTSDLEIHSGTLLSDGKIIITGTFSMVNGVSRKMIAVLNSDGSLDSSFDSSTNLTNQYISTATQLQNGKYFVGGLFGVVTTDFHAKSVACFNSNGTMDTAFNKQEGMNNSPNALQIQSDGKIIVGGAFHRFNDIVINNVTRLNSNGSLDASFNHNNLSSTSVIRDIKLQQDGKILVGGGLSAFDLSPLSDIVRLNSDGTIDSGFNVGTGANGEVRSILVQPDGKVLIGGNFTNYNGSAITRIARLNSDGTLDSSFNIGTGPDAIITAMQLQSDGKIIIAGSFANYNGVASNKVARLNANGTLDTSFSAGFGTRGLANQIEVLSDGKIIIAGPFDMYNNSNAFGIVRLNSNGSKDTGFHFPTLQITDRVLTFEVLPNGQITIGGYFTLNDGSGNAMKNLARINTDGTPDFTFPVGVTSNGSISVLKSQQDGKIIIGGSFTAYNSTGRNHIARVNATTLLSSSENAFINENIMAYKKGSEIHIESVGNQMNSVTLYDLSGKVVFKNDNVNSSQTVINGFSSKNQILILKVVNSNNSVVNKKIVF